MGNLIKNEVIKILKKKSIYILLIITVAYAILTNCIYKFLYSNLDSLLVDDKYEITALEKQLNELDPKKASDISEYISVKSQLETLELKQKYEKGSWQEYVVENRIAPIISEKNGYIFQLEKTEDIQTKLDILQAQYDSMISILNGSAGSDGWKQFVYVDIETTKLEIEVLKQQRDVTENSTEKRETEKAIKKAERTLETLEKRIEKNISYGNDSMNTYIDYYIQLGAVVDENAPDDQTPYAQKLEYNSSKELYEVSKYALETGKDVNKMNTSRGIMQNVFNEYGMFILILIVIIAGTIVSSEFEKGTIKLLLIKPYSRIKILLSKYIVVLFTIIGFMAAVVFIQFIMGGLFFGFDSFSIPVVHYDFGANKLVEMSNLQFLFTQALAVLPEFILIATLAFMLSTVTTNSALSITMGILTYVVGGIINSLATSFNVKFLKFFFTMNWDLNQYLFGGLPKLESMSLAFSIIMCIVYFCAFIIPSFVVFKKKNIKNV